MEKAVFRKVINTLCALLVILAAGWFAIRLAGSPASNAIAPARQYAVVLDAGHGGADGGAVGISGTVEAGLNLAVAKLTKAELEARGITVIMTREDENALADNKQEDMKARKRIINGGADLVISIHMNKFSDRSIKGSMVYYMQGSAEGERLAQCVVDAVCDATGQRRRLPNPGDYYIVRESPLPSVIVECGFLSNLEDEQKLLSPEHQARLAQGIAAGVLQYLAAASATNLA